MEEQSLSQVQAMLRGYSEDNEKKNKKKTKEEIFAQYFKPKKEKEVFRILPVKPGKKFFYDVAYFHLVSINTSGGTKRDNVPIYCICKNEPKVPKKDKNGEIVRLENGDPIMVPQECPFCKKHQELISKQNPSVKFKKFEEMTDGEKKIKENNDKLFKEASKWEAKKHYIIRGIDRNAQLDGVKYWRIKHNFKQQGIMDKMLPILGEYVERNEADFMSPVDGTDLSISLSPSTWKGVNYMEVRAVSAIGKSPLHQDKYIMNKWLSDTTTWRDVFQPKTAPNITPKQYMEFLLEGNDPYYDEMSKKWRFPGSPKLEELANTKNINLAANGGNDEYASDLDEVTQSAPTINTIKTEDVKVTQDEGYSLVDNKKVNVEDSSVDEVLNSNDDDEPTDDPYDDLPF